MKTLVQEADPEALSVNTIERMFEKQRAEADAEFAEDNDDDGDDAADDDTKSVFTTVTTAPAPWTKPSTNTASHTDASIADMLRSSSLDR